MNNYIKTTKIFTEDNTNISNPTLVETSISKLCKNCLNLTFNSKNRNNILNTISNMRNMFKNIKNGNSNDKLRIITVNKKSNNTVSTQQKSYTAADQNRQFAYNTFVTGGVSKWIGSADSAFTPTIEDNQAIQLEFDPVTNEIVSYKFVSLFTYGIHENIQNTTKEKKFAYLKLTPQNTLQVILSNENQQLKEQTDHLINLIRFSNDVVLYQNRYHVLIDTNTHQVMNIFGKIFVYKQSRKVQDMLFTQQITIDIDFHDETDIDVIQQKKLQVIDKMKESIIFPYIENSLRGIHCVFTFDSKLNSQQVDLISALLRFYMVFKLKIDDVDHNAVGAMRLTREIYGIQRGEINKKVYVTFNAPIAYDNHYFNYHNLLDLLLNYFNENRLNFEIYNSIKRVLPKQLYKELQLTEAQKEIINNFVNQYLTINTEKKTKNNTVIKNDSLSATEKMKLNKQKFLDQLENITDDNSDIDIDENLNCSLMEQRRQILNNKKLTQANRYKLLNPINIQFMLNNPLNVKELKNDVLQALYLKNWDYVKSQIDFPEWDEAEIITDNNDNVVSMLNEWGKISTNYVFNAVKHYFNSFSLSQLFSEFIENKTISSPFYPDKTPSFIFNGKLFTHYSAKPCGNFFTLIMWMVVSNNLNYYRNLSLTNMEQVEKQLKIDTTLTLAESLGLPVYIPVHIDKSKEAFISQIHESGLYDNNFLQTNFNPKQNKESAKIETEKLIFNYNFDKYVKNDKNYNNYLTFAHKIYEESIKFFTKGFNHEIMIKIIDYIIASIFMKHNRSDKQTDIYEEQTYMLTKTISEHLSISYPTVKSYLRYLLVIHFFERQVHIDDISDEYQSYKQNRIKGHNLANFLSLTNYDLFAMLVIDNAKKIKDYIDSNKILNKKLKNESITIKKSFIKNVNTNIINNFSLKENTLTDKNHIITNYNGTFIENLMNKDISYAMAYEIRSTAITKLTIVDYVNIFDFNYLKKVFSKGLILGTFKKRNIPYTNEMEYYVNRHQSLHNFIKNLDSKILDKKINFNNDIVNYLNNSFDKKNQKKNKQIRSAFKDQINNIIDVLYTKEDIFYDKPCFFIHRENNKENKGNISPSNWKDVNDTIVNKKIPFWNITHTKKLSTYKICMINNLQRVKQLIKNTTINHAFIKDNNDKLYSLLLKKFMANTIIKNLKIKF